MTILPPDWFAQASDITIRGHGDVFAFGAQEGAVVLAGIQGFDMPPSVVTHTNPGGWDGGLFESARFGVRDLFLPVGMWADGSTDFRALKRRFAALVDPKAGFVTVTVSQLDGTTRTIEGRYVGGMDGTLSVAEGLHQQRIGIELRCFDPAWVGPSAEVIRLKNDPGPPFLSSPFFPMEVGPSDVIGRVTITNPGEMDAYPVFRVDGPATNVKAVNGAQSWEFTGTVPVGSWLVVDTRRGVQEVYDSSGSRWADMGIGSFLWPIRPGVNDVDVTVNAAGDTTMVTVTYAPRYLTAW